MSLCTTCVIISHLNQSKHFFVEFLRDVRTVHLQIEVFQWYLHLADHEVAFVARVVLVFVRDTWYFVSSHGI